MQSVKKGVRLLLFVIVLLPCLMAWQPAFAKKCTGSANCTACSNCSSCKHCAKQGGSCGVCGSGESDRDGSSYSDNTSSGGSGSPQDDYSTGTTIIRPTESRNSSQADNSNNYRAPESSGSSGLGWFVAILLAMYILVKSASKKKTS